MNVTSSATSKQISAYLPTFLDITDSVLQSLINRMVYSPVVLSYYF